MNKKFLLSLFLIFLPLTSLSSQEEKIYFASLLTKEPLLDGKLDDSAWENVPEATGFVVLGTETLATKQTFLKVVYSDEAIYVGIRCEEPEVDEIQAKFKDGDVKICGDDSVEAFLFPKDAETYFQFMVNTEGYRANTKDLQGSLPLWNWQAKTYKGKDFYSMEIKIPFEIFFAVPEKDDAWKINIARNTLTSGDRYTCWPYLKKLLGFHDTARFGKLVFPEEVSEEKVKSKIISCFKGKIANNLNLLSNFKKGFSENKEDAFLQRKIELFLKSCEEIERFSKPELENLSIKQINLLFKESRELVFKGEKLKQELRRENLLKSLFE